MRYFPLAALLAAVLIGPLPACAAQEDVLATLRKGHPRLLVLDDDIAQVRRQIESDPTAKRWFEKLKSSAEMVTTQPVSQRVLIGPRLLQVSRQVLNRVSLLAGLYRLTGEQRYAQRARDEMLAAAKFEDWHPVHFLDTAEMTNALAIGYDWLYDVLSAEERAIIKSAIVEKGLKPGLEVYAKPTGWHKITSNWNQVCNGGLTVGALAVADEEPEIARKVIESARASIPLAMAHFAPDGGCDEGPGYWSYATRYNVFYLQAMHTALGTDFGLLKSPGLAETGLFRIHAAGPFNQSFNFADAGASTGSASQMFWLARVFDRPVYAAFERLHCVERDRIDPFHLLWFNPDGSDKEIEQLPTAAVFRRINVATMRSAWNDPAVAFVGFKGGDNAASHAHADLGTFVYDVDGVRWALDLGPDDYNLPAYFGNKRYTYYRLRSEGHNTLTIGNDNQSTKAKAPLLAFSPDPRAPLAVADLTAGYAPKAKRVYRGVQLLGKQLLIQDEVEADEPIEIVWNFHTDATPAIDPAGDVATLRHGTKTLIARILQPKSARFDTVSANPQPPQMQQPKVVNLVIRQPEKITSLQLVVLLMPQGAGSDEVATQPLENWIKAHPLDK